MPSWKYSENATRCENTKYDGYPRALGGESASSQSLPALLSLQPDPFLHRMDLKILILLVRRIDEKISAEMRERDEVNRAGWGVLDV
jgi:hypothetical protein